MENIASAHELSAGDLLWSVGITLVLMVLSAFFAGSNPFDCWRFSFSRPLF